eukprot:6181344-Pleurochrysis_carterae.AAC.3
MANALRRAGAACPHQLLGLRGVNTSVRAAVFAEFCLGLDNSLTIAAPTVVAAANTALLHYAATALLPATAVLIKAGALSQWLALPWQHRKRSFK